MTKTLEEMIAELRRLDAEEIQEKVARHLCKLMGDEWKLGSKLYMSTAKEILDDIALPELLKALETPVAWLHEITEPDGLHSVMLSQSPENPWSHWLSSHSKQCVYVRKPLFALPPHGGGDEG